MRRRYRNVQGRDSKAPWDMTTLWEDKAFTDANQRACD